MLHLTVLLLFVLPIVARVSPWAVRALDELGTSVPSTFLPSFKEGPGLGT